jgi:hypothetical protein
MFGYFVKSSYFDTRFTGRGSARLERLVRDQEVGGSNPPAPTLKPANNFAGFVFSN